MGEQDRAGDFARALDDAITQRGVTLSYLHRRLGELATPVSVATLSYWRSGRSQPERPTSLAAVGVLEEVLGLRAGALATRLRPPRRPGPPGRQVPIEQLTGHEEIVRAALGSLGFETAHDELGEEAMSLSLDLDEQGRARQMSVLLRWRALVPGARRAAAVVTLDEPVAGAPRIVPRAGVAVGRSVAAADHPVHVSELILERPLEVGEFGLGEYVIHLPDTTRRDGSLAYYAPRRVSQALVWARFHPDALPRRFESFDAVDGEEATGEMVIGGGHSLHRHAGPFGPGTLGLRWWW